MSHPGRNVPPAGSDTGHTLPLVFGHCGSVAVGHQVTEVVTADRSDDPWLAGRVSHALARSGDDTSDGSVARAYGTLSFRRDAPAAFVVPQHLERTTPDRLASRLDPKQARTSFPTPRRRVDHATPDDAGYAGLVRSALTRLATDDLRKVVLGRWLDVVCEPPVDASALLGALLTRTDHAFVFGLPPEAVAGGGGSLVGASPELLVSRHGRAVRSVPLAGSAKRSSDPREDRRRAEALVRSEKDRHEHALVVDSVAAALRGVCSELDAPEHPHLVATDSMWHLATDVRGELRSAGPHAPTALALAQLLHPTPAVCGSPRAHAYDVVESLEDNDRGVMTGAVGWVDGFGDGEFAVTIRSALVDGNLVRLFAGAGVVPGSDPDAEAVETAAKLTTMLSALDAS